MQAAQSLFEAWGSSHGFLWDLKVPIRAIIAIASSGDRIV